MSGALHLPWRRAVRAGAVAWAVATLVVALAASPVVATHSDFNHVHPKGTPPHAHALSTVFVGLQAHAAPAPSDAPEPLLVAVVLTPGLHAADACPCAVRVRGPPARA